MTSLQLKTILFRFTILFIIDQYRRRAGSKKYFLVATGFSTGNGHDIRPIPPDEGINTFDLSIEYHLCALVSAGLYGIFYHNSFTWKSSSPVIYGYKNTWQGVDGGLKIIFHMAPLLKINTRYMDIYLSAFSGFRQFSYREKGINTIDIYADRFDYTLHTYSAGGIAGCRFFFNKKLGAYTELGCSGKIFVNAGLTIAFPGRY